MFSELGKTDYGKVRSLFLSLEFHLASLAVLDGINPGRCFVDSLDIPRTAFLLSPEGCYLAGNTQNPHFNHALSQAILSRSTLGEDVKELGFVLTSDVWVESLANVFSPYTPIAIVRRHYVCEEPTFDWQTHVPEGFTVCRITGRLLNRLGLKVPDHVYGWIRNNWGTTSWFLKRGFGFITMHGAEVVSWSLADCVSGTRCEIGIRTAPNYRRRGLATVTAAASVDYALSHGFSMVGWHCDNENLGSIGTAEKVGFKKERNYTMYYLLLDEASESIGERIRTHNIEHGLSTE